MDRSQDRGSNIIKFGRYKLIIELIVDADNLARILGQTDSIGSKKRVAYKKFLAQNPRDRY